MREFIENRTISITIGSRTYEIHIPLANDREATLLGRYLENASFDDIWEQIILEEEYDSYWMRRDFEWYFSSQSDGG